MGTPSDPRPHGEVETGQIDPLAGWRGPWTPDGQADWIELWYTLASSRTQVKALNWWDFSDSQSFIGHAGLIDSNGQPKPAYKRLQSWRQKYGIGKQIIRLREKDECLYSRFFDSSALDLGRKHSSR